MDMNPRVKGYSRWQIGNIKLYRQTSEHSNPVWWVITQLTKHLIIKLS